MKIKNSDIFKIWYNSFSVGETGLIFGEKAVFLLIVTLLEENSSLTQYDVIKLNNAPEKTTYNIISKLIKKGYLSSTRSNQYFSRSYLSLTEKGLLLKAHIRKVLLKGL
jgi:DNA-binding MarR family transcriptional regulator